MEAARTAAADPDAERLVVPIGRDLGAVRSGEELHRSLALGTRVIELDERQYTAWSLAHGTPAVVNAAAPWHLSSVVELARAAGMGDLRPDVDMLVEQGLLVELEPESEATTEFARKHRVVPTMVGLGNTAENPAMFGIGFLGRPVIDVDFPTYDLWQWSLMDSTLWDACESAADVSGAATAAASYLEPGKLLVEFLRAMPGLIYARAAYVDVAFRLRRPSSGSAG